MDKQITCGDCGKDFTFSKNDQDFYQEKGYTQPKRCKTCREKRKQEKGNR